MFDPDYKEKKRESPPEIPKPRPTPNLMSEKDRLKYYISQDPGTRRYFGFGMDENRRLIIEDLEKLNRFDAETKEMLREIYRELK